MKHLNFTSQFSLLIRSTQQHESPPFPHQSLPDQLANNKVSRSQLVCAPDESENNDAKPFPEWKARVVPFVRLRNPTGRGSLILVQFRAQRDRLTRATRLETSFDKVNADTVFRRLDKLTAARMYTRASRPFLALPSPR